MFIIRNICLLLSLVLNILIGANTFDNTVQYTIKLDNNNARRGEVVSVLIDFKIANNFYVYSTNPEKSLSPTSIEWEDSSYFDIVGILEEPNPQTKYSESLKMDISFHESKNVKFKQSLKISENIIPGNYEFNGTLIYQACDPIKCIPHWDDFSLVINIEDGPTRQALVKEIPMDFNLNHDDKEGVELNRVNNNFSSLIEFFLMALIAGLAALLTPCVFPMIPMTVAFFTGQEKSRPKAIKDAAFFGISIIFIYSILGIGVSIIFGAEIANEIATSAVANIIFFIIFCVFALSFLGAFDIVLPSSFVNKMNKNADKGGLLGVFFMAFTLVLVSFSCTGPIVGTVLIESAKGEIIKPVIGMLGFSLAFAVPFTLFAIFPEWMQSLPKSGGWLNSVKVVLGFLELALGLKFLSIADQAYHWGILDREIYLAIWIVIFSIMGIYLLGKLQLAHDSPVENLSVTRLILAICTFTFVLYMIPGMFGAPLKGLSGYLPPMSTQDFDINRLIREQNQSYNLDSSDKQFPANPRFSTFLHLPHGIDGFFSYKEGLEYARSVNKPLFIDFTGHGCVNCRKMEEYVWSNTNVLKRLRDDFVVVALYVDDKTILPEEEWYVSKYDNKIKKTLGKQNFDLQIDKFESNAQPYYVLLDHDEKLLNEPTAYNIDVDRFIDFLDEGKNNFEEKK
jgi:thiol:disulfide interchange protein DsbD